MEKRALVSVVTATYNSAETLRDTVESVLSQDYENVQHIIVDGGSSDGTIELVKELEPLYNGRLIWISEPDQGIYDAMNKGVKLATGDIIGILNSDDLYSGPDALSSIARTFAATDCDAVYADLVYVEWNDTARVTRKWVAGVGSYRWGWNPPHPTLYMTKGLYAQVGEYRTDYKISSDYDFMLRAFWRGTARATYLNKTLVRMRQGGESTSGLASNRLAFGEAQRSLRVLGAKHPTLTNAMRVLRKVRQFARR